VKNVREAKRAKRKWDVRGMVVQAYSRAGR
jgi:hypothetical protein